MRSVVVQCTVACLASVAFAASVAAQAPPAIQPPASRPAVPPVPPAGEPPLYRLAPGDSLDVKFDVVTEFNETVKVRPDGFISLPRVGEVKAVGLTPAELSAELRQKFAAVTREPALTVIVRDFTVQQVFVGGEVGTPGVVPLRGRVTTLQAILSSGGPRVSARLSDVVLLRYVAENQAEAYKIDLQKVVDGRAADMTLLPFDVVFVPRSKIANVDLFVQQYMSDLVPRSLVFPYNLNSVVVTRVQQ